MAGSLQYCLYGPADGGRVVFEYGTPGTRFLAPDRIRPVNELGIRLLVADRPGYGGSTRLPVRTVAARAGDIAAVAGHLGWEQFAVWGGSGGAPPALACAARLGSRVTRWASVVGPAPFDAEGLDWYAGMSPGNVEEFTRARAGESAYRPLVEQLARDAVAAVTDGQLPVADDYELAEADRAALTAQLTAPGHQFRTWAAYIGGIDGYLVWRTGCPMPARAHRLAPKSRPRRRAVRPARRPSPRRARPPAPLPLAHTLTAA